MYSWKSLEKKHSGYYWETWVYALRTNGTGERATIFHKLLTCPRHQASPAPSVEEWVPHWPLEHLRTHKAKDEASHPWTSTAIEQWHFSCHYLVLTFVCCIFCNYAIIYKRSNIGYSSCGMVGNFVIPIFQSRLNKFGVQRNLGKGMIFLIKDEEGKYLIRKT